MPVGKEFREAYVDAYYPGLAGYVYNGDCYDEETGREIMEGILEGVVWYEHVEDVGPVLHMRDGRALFVFDSNDFPQPTDEDVCDEPRTTLPIRAVRHRAGALAEVQVEPYFRWRP